MDILLKLRILWMNLKSEIYCPVYSPQTFNRHFIGLFKENTISRYIHCQLRYHVLQRIFLSTKHLMVSILGDRILTQIMTFKLKWHFFPTPDAFLSFSFLSLFLFLPQCIEVQFITSKILAFTYVYTLVSDTQIKIQNIFVTPHRSLVSLCTQCCPHQEVTIPTCVWLCLSSSVTQWNPVFSFVCGFLLST